MDLFDYLRYSSSLSVVIPTFIGIVRSRNLGVKLKFLLLYLIITLIKEIICVRLSLQKERNLHIYNLALIFNMIPLFLVYYYEFSEKLLKNVVLALITVATIFSVANITLIQGIEVFNTFSVLVINFFLTALTLLYFYTILKKAENLNLIKIPLFWMSAGLLVYSAGTFLIFSLYEIYNNLSYSTSVKIWAINSILYILLNLLFSIAFLCQPRKMT